MRRIAGGCVWLGVWVLAVGCAGPTPPAGTAAAIPAAKPRARPHQPTPTLTRAETLLFRGLNRQRARHGLAALRLRADLVAMARRHSREMMRRGRLGHLADDGATLPERAARSSVNYQRVGENVARNRGYADPPGQAVKSWMGSPEHRQTILNDRYEEIGLGAARCPITGTHYFTSIFCVRKKAPPGG